MKDDRVYWQGRPLPERPAPAVPTGIIILSAFVAIVICMVAGYIAAHA